jgi:hypothetical protein
MAGPGDERAHHAVETRSHNRVLFLRAATMLRRAIEKCHANAKKLFAFLTAASGINELSSTRRIRVSIYIYKGSQSCTTMLEQ